MASVEAAPRPAGTVTFLFTDIEGSTPLWDAQPAGMRLALQRHDEILGSAIAEYHGHIFATMGDGLAAAFQTAGDAVAASLDVQNRLADETWSAGIELRVRMGLHTGEVDERDGDYLGPPVNRAARLMGVANGRQIVMSTLTAGLVEGASNIETVDLGEVLLKGISEPIRVFGVAGMGHDWLDLPLASTQQSAGNLPRPNTDYVGDLADLQRRVARLSQARLVTLTGSGGVGKTRAALEVGWLVLDEYAGGAWFVDLAPVADPDAVAAAVASALHINPQPSMTLEESIVDWCRGRRMLLIIDNCEHLLGPLVDLVALITTACERTTVLATSREPLGVAGEIVIRIPSLDTDHRRELFVQRARASAGGFDPTNEDLGAIDAICERLDGIPLAIELAASRIRSLSPTELLERLTDRFRLLRSGPRGGIERHQTLRATVRWSYQLLDEQDRRLFDRLSVFAGGFDLDAAEQVCADETIDEFDLADLLGDLVDKSMVTAERHESTTRYRLLETLRQYGEERLDERDETAEFRARHATHYVGVAAHIGQQWSSPDQLDADRRFGREWDNIRSAHHWLVLTGDGNACADIVRSVGCHAWARVRSEVREWAERTRGLLGSECPASVLSEIAYWTYMDGNWTDAIDLAQLAVADTSDLDGAALGRSYLVFALQSAARADEIPPLISGLASATNDPAVDSDQRWRSAWTLFQCLMTTPEAGATLQGLVSISEELDVPIYNAELQRMRGLAHLSAQPPDLGASITELAKAIEMTEAVSQRASWAHINLAIAVVLAQEPNMTAVVRSSVTAAYDGRNWAATALGMELTAHVLAHAGCAEEAETVVGPLLTRPPGFPGDMADAFRADIVDTIGEHPDNEARQARGRAMDRHDMVKYALGALDGLIARSPPG